MNKVIKIKDIKLVVHEVKNRDWNMVYYQVRRQTVDQVWNRAREQVYSQVRTQIYNQVRTQVYSQNSIYE